MLEHSNWVVQFCFSAVFSYSCILLCSCILLRHGWWRERASRLQKYHCGQLSLRLPFFTLETWAPIFKASYENLSKQTSKEKLEINLKKVLILKNLKKNLGKVMKNLGNICDRLRKILGCFKIVPRGPLAGSCTHIRWPCALWGKITFVLLLPYFTVRCTACNRYIV